MHKRNITDSDLEAIVRQTFQDDLPPELEARLNRRFFQFRQSLDKPERSGEQKIMRQRYFLLRSGFLAAVSAVMLLLGAILQWNNTPNALALSIENLKVSRTLTAGLAHASFMSCTLTKKEAGGESVYTVRWRANGEFRIDKTAPEGVQWFRIARDNDAGGPGYKVLFSAPPNAGKYDATELETMQFFLPRNLIRFIEKQTVFFQTRNVLASADFKLTGRDGPFRIEMLIDAHTCLPKEIGKYLCDSPPSGLKAPVVWKASFRWNQPIADELFQPFPVAEK